jgi:FkbM family methyltransferase
MKYLIHAICKRFGVALSRASNARDLIDFIRDREIDTVIDVGANIGQFGQALRSMGYRGKIISFEPIASEYQTLTKKVAGDSNWKVHPFGLGTVAGEATINVSEDSSYSSILPLSDAAIQFDQKAVVERNETIQMRTLDQVASCLSGKILLKIDTQGYEKQVIEGGRHTLPRLKGIWMELPIIHLYEGNWKFHEAIQYMDDLGFVPAQFHPVNHHCKDTVSLVEVNCLFRPQ